MSAQIVRYPMLVDGKIPARFLPDMQAAFGWQSLAVGVGFLAPTWGASPQVGTSGALRLLRGQIERGAADFMPAATVATGQFTAGRRMIAVSSTGTVLLETTATTMVVSEILSGASPQWISLDGLTL